MSDQFLELVKRQCDPWGNKNACPMEEKKRSRRKARHKLKKELTKETTNDIQ